MTLNDLADSYVHLVLAIGQHDSGYVDAYYGPAEWKAQAHKLPLHQVLTSATTLVDQFDQCPAAEPQEALRQQLLGLHIRAAHAYVRKLMGEIMIRILVIRVSYNKLMNQRSKPARKFPLTRR